MVYISATAVYSLSRNGINFILIMISWLVYGQTYKPPIGIQTPEFGVEESHLMYENALYDFGNGPRTYRDAGNGPYTHYVDQSDPNATDMNNPYGTKDIPRLTIPLNVKAGSVVEVHNGPYTYAQHIHGGKYLPIVNYSGTAERPIFIRGASRTERFEVGEHSGGNGMLLRDVSYLIIENMYVNGPGVKVYQPSDHLSFRYSEFTGEDGSTGITLWTYKLDFTEGDLKQDIVIYNNEIHDNGRYPAVEETGRHGIMIDDASKNVWVIDNNIYNNGDDGIQVINRTWVQNIGPAADQIFIGRNVIHHDGENAIDIKGSTNVIITQNEIYGYEDIFTPSSSAGEAIRINDEGGQDNIWILYNHIYDSEQGINPDGALFKPYIIGNIIHDCSDYGINRDSRIVANNVIYNCGMGVGRKGEAQMELSGNIIANCKDAYGYCQECPKSESAKSLVRNNLLYNNGPGKPCMDCIVEDPLFVNVLENDFRLRPGSPAVGKGMEASAYDAFEKTYGIDIRVDFSGYPRPKGSAWDIGAYQSYKKN